jgi:soluble lytic murein transglycosylase-like protein
LQNEADAAGGCWQPEHNLAVGAHFLAGLIVTHGGNLLAAMTAYNGSGPSADRYGAQAVALIDHYRTELS